MDWAKRRARIGLTWQPAMAARKPGHRQLLAKEITVAAGRFEHEAHASPAISSQVSADRLGRVGNALVPSGSCIEEVDIRLGQVAADIRLGQVAADIDMMYHEPCSCGAGSVAAAPCKCAGSFSRRREGTRAASGLNRPGPSRSPSRRRAYTNTNTQDLRFKTLKAEPKVRASEMIWRTVFQSRQHATAAIGRWIDGFYNPVRRHSTLDYVSPVAFERQAA